MPSKTTYFGWDNVPVGAMVKTRSRSSNRREFFLKLDQNRFQVYTPGGKFDEYTYRPDNWTTGEYKLVK